MYRPEKVASVIMKIVAVEILELTNPCDATVSVTTVDVTPSLKEATIWISAYGRDKEIAVERVKEHLPSLNKLIASKITTKFTPRLRIKLDTSLDHITRINDLLDNQG